MLLLVLRHVDADHCPVVVEEELGEGPRQLRLANAGRPEEDEAPERPVRVRQPGPAASYRIGHRHDGVVLADDAAAQPIFHPHELLDLALDEPADRDVRPLADDGGDVVLVDLLLQHARRRAVRRVAAGAKPLLQFGDAPVPELGRARVVAFPLRPLDLVAQRLELALDAPAALDLGLLVLPLRPEAVAFLPEVRQLPLEAVESAA